MAIAALSFWIHLITLATPFCCFLLWPTFNWKCVYALMTLVITILKSFHNLQRTSSFGTLKVVASVEIKVSHNQCCCWNRKTATHAHTHRDIDTHTRARARVLLWNYFKLIKADVDKKNNHSGVEIDFYNDMCYVCRKRQLLVVRVLKKSRGVHLHLGLWFTLSCKNVLFSYFL